MRVSEIALNVLVIILLAGVILLYVKVQHG